jgi:hypothetical protein
MAKRFLLLFCLSVAALIVVHSAGQTASDPGPFVLPPHSLATSDVNGNLNIWNLDKSGDGEVNPVWSVKCSPYTSMVFADLDGDGTEELIAGVCQDIRVEGKIRIFLNVYKKGIGEDRFPKYPGLWQTTYYSDPNSVMDNDGMITLARGHFGKDGHDSVVLLTPSYLLTYESRNSEKEGLVKASTLRLDSWSAGSLATGTIAGRGETIAVSLSNILAPNTWQVFLLHPRPSGDLSQQTGAIRLSASQIGERTVRLRGPIQIADTDGDGQGESIWSAGLHMDNSLVIKGWVFGSRATVTEKLARIAPNAVIVPRLIATGDIDGIAGDELAVSYVNNPNGTGDRIETWNISGAEPVRRNVTEYSDAVPSLAIDELLIARNKIIAAGRWFTGSESSGESYLELFSPVLSSIWKRTGIQGEGEILCIAAGKAK